MALHYDKSDRSVLAWCDECSWIDIVTNYDIALRIGVDHYWRVHPDEQRTIHTAYTAQYRRRVAAQKA